MILMQTCLVRVWLPRSWLVKLSIFKNLLSTLDPLLQISPFDSQQVRVELVGLKTYAVIVGRQGTLKIAATRSMAFLAKMMALKRVRGATTLSASTTRHLHLHRFLLFPRVLRLLGFWPSWIMPTALPHQLETTLFKAPPPLLPVCLPAPLPLWCRGHLASRPLPYLNQPLLPISHLLVVVIKLIMLLLIWSNKVCNLAVL